MTDRKNHGALAMLLVLYGTAFIAAFNFLLAFVHRQNRIDNPLIDLHPMKNPNFWPATILLIITMMQTFSMSVLLPLYFESVFSETALVAGMLLLPPVLLNAVATVRDAAQILVDTHTSDIPVIDGQRRVVGFISDARIMRR